MVNGHDSSLQDKLRQAEEAETEVQRLGDLAADAPRLRTELAKAQRRAERDRNRRTALEQARKEMAAASEKQAEGGDHGFTCQGVLLAGAKRYFL